MSMKELLGGDCGQQNPVLRVASHFAGNGTGDAPINLLERGRGSQDHSNIATHDPRGAAGSAGVVLLPPTTFRMDSLLKEIQSLDRSNGPAQAPRVVDLTRSKEWVQEFQSNDLAAAHEIDNQKWAEEFHAATCGNGAAALDLDRAWDGPIDLPVSSLHPPQYHHMPQVHDTLSSARDLLDDSKWTQEFEQQSKTELMTTAEEFIQSINDPTIKATEFMSFVEKLSTGEATVENRQQTDPVDRWVGEFERTVDSNIDQTWAREYEGAIGTDVDSEAMNPTEREEYWQKLQSEWEKAAEESSLHPWLSELQEFDQPYRFEEENPFKELDDPMEEGKKRLMVSDIPAAALLFEAAVQKHPDNPEAWYLLGTTQALNEQDPQAVSALSKCIDIDPTNLKALMALAASLTNESYYLQACRTLKTWLKQNPEYADLLPENVEKPSVTSSLLSSELTTVQALYIKAARKRPANNLDPDVQCGLGILFNLSSDYDKAADCFQAAVSADPNNALLWNRLGATLANGGKSAEAIGAYSKALDIMPGFIRTRYNLGIACVNLGSYREAAEHFLAALNMQASSSNTVTSSSSAVKNPTMSDSIWTSLRMVLHLLDKGMLSSAIDKRDLITLNREFA